jgi:tetratricopeptide (TPR) repeat protein
MRGRVLAEAFEKPPEVTTIPSWEEVPGDSGRHAEQGAEDAWDSNYALRQLAELGYIDKPSDDAREIVAMARNHYDFNLARVYLVTQRPADALPLLERLVRDKPQELAFQLHLAQCYYELGRKAECRATAEAVLQKDSNRPAAGLILANLHLAEGRIEEGLQLLLEAEKSTRPAPTIRYHIGLLYLRQRRWEEAELVFESVLGMDSDHAPAQAGLAQALLAQNKAEEAAEAALDAIRLQFNLPHAHYTLGVALAKRGHIERARHASGP